MKTEQAIKKLGQTLWDILGREYIDKYCEDKNGNLVSVSSISVDGIAEELVNAGYGDVSEYKAEIERLKAENEKLLDSIESVQAGRCRLRCPLTEQAVKEFAERLKKYSYTDNCFKDGKWHRYVLVSDIDELIGGKEK